MERGYITALLNSRTSTQCHELNSCKLLRGTKGYAVGGLCTVCVGVSLSNEMTNTVSVKQEYLPLPSRIGYYVNEIVDYIYDLGRFIPVLPYEDNILI